MVKIEDYDIQNSETEELVELKYQNTFDYNGYEVMVTCIAIVKVEKCADEIMSVEFVGWHVPILEIVSEPDEKFEKEFWKNKEKEVQDKICDFVYNELDP